MSHFFDCCWHASFLEKVNILWLRPNYRYPIIEFIYKDVVQTCITNILFCNPGLCMLCHYIFKFFNLELQRSSYHLVSKYWCCLNNITLSGYLSDLILLPTLGTGIVASNTLSCCFLIFIYTYWWLLFLHMLFMLLFI